ncbi:hypothetical protein [Streptomyces macrosporus]|uniref:hypothetical protein n=1 Tax=Streptomyces macrosporus TaxID=44032 RepID=UPI0031DEED1A
MPEPGLADRVTEAVVGRLGGDAAERLLWQVSFFDAPAARWWARQTVNAVAVRAASPGVAPRRWP